MFKIIKYVLIAVIFLGVVGCAQNNLTVRLAYSRLDNTIYKRLNEYAEFNPQQKEWIKRAAQDFQVQHRKTELPRYAEYLDNLVSRLSETQTFSYVEVENVFRQLQLFSRSSYELSPFYNSVEFLQTLEDNQVTQVGASFDKRNREQLERIAEQAVDGSIESRVERTAKTLSRAGLDLNTRQKKILAEGFGNYVGKREDRVEAWQDWQQNFLRLLSARNESAFSEEMKNHLMQYQKQMELKFPARTKQNQATAIKTAQKILNSLEDDQTKALVRQLSKYRDIFTAMSKSNQTRIL